MKYAEANYYLVNISTAQNPDDVVITLAIRTPLTKGGKGGLKDTPLDGILYKILVEVVNRSRIDPQMVEDICVGNVCSLLIRRKHKHQPKPSVTTNTRIGQ